MAENSKIEWTEHTFSPWWGCTKVSDGCANCYAERDSKHWGFDCFGPGKERRRLSEATWRNPIKWNKAAEKAGKRVRVFPSMCDVFDPEGPHDERMRLFSLINETPYLLWMLLTKRPENIRSMLPVVGWEKPWENVWFGVTVEDNRYRHRIDDMFKIPAAGYFISHEPALGPLDLQTSLLTARCDGRYPFPTLEGKYHTKHIHWLDLVITGGESGPNARPMHPDWARGVRDQCLAAGVPWMFKQWGEYGAQSVNISTGEPVFRMINNFETWVNKASTWIGRDDTCVDFDGKILRNGADWKNAQYPVALMRRIGKKKAGRVLDGRVWDGELNNG